MRYAITKLFFLAVSGIAFVSGCKEDRKFKCENAGEILHAVSMGEGYLFLNEELNAYMIRYHVPGSIDSFWTGAICSGEFSTIDVPASVVFSGDFMDDKGTISPSSVIGGEEFYYLNLTGLE